MSRIFPLRKVYIILAAAVVIALVGILVTVLDGQQLAKVSNLLFLNAA